MDIQALTAAVLPRKDAVEQSMRRAKQFEKLMRSSAAFEASMRHAEKMEELMRPSPAMEAAMEHAKRMEELMRPSPAMEAAMEHAKRMEELMRPSPAMEAAMEHAKRMEELMRPSPAMEAAMEHAKRMEELMRPSPAIETAMEHAKQLERLMRPSAAFEESARQAAHLADMLGPTRFLTESLQRTRELADAMRPMRAFEESVRRTQELADAANIGNALRNFIWQGENQHDADIISGDPNTDEPELIVSREFGAESLLVPDNRILIRGCAPSLLALRRLFSKGVDLGKITWRELEEIVGDLLSLEGYDVVVGRGTKDNGIDVLASKMLPHVGLLRTVWQAKHLNAGNKVALKTIRELADIRDQAQATKGIIVTTGFLTSGALNRIRQDAYRLGKMERPELESWIRRMLQRPK